MTLQNLYFFSEIIKDMNLGVSADRLYTSQQALSGHIKRLEQHFGVKLFERRPNLVLTEEGKALARETKVILDAESRLFIEFGTGVQKDHGTLRIACGLGRTKYYLPRVLSRFSMQYPAVAVTCVDENIYKDTPMFEKGEVDLAIGRTMNAEPGVKSQRLFRIGSSIIISKKLLAEHVGGDVDKFIREAVENGVSLEQLPKTIPVIHSGMPGQEHWLCETIPAMRDFPRVYISHGNSDMLFELCRAGRAMVLISDMYCRFIQEHFSAEQQEDVLFFPHVLDGEPIWTDEVLNYNSRVSHPQFFFDFINILMDDLKERKLLYSDITQHMESGRQ